MRQLDFADGFETPTAPTQGTLSTTALQVFANDAAYVTAKGSAAANGDLYYNSTTNNIRYYRSAEWVNLLKQVITGTRAAPTAITAVGGVTASTSAQIEYQFVEGSGGAVDISANPQVSAGTFSGQRLVLIGRHDTNTVKLEHGTGLALNGVCFLAADSVLSLVWDGTNWVEESRNDI